MQLDPSRTIDRRTPLQRATRKELELFAKSRGVTEISCGMPAELMRKILELRGHTDIHNFIRGIRHRHLGQPNGTNSRIEQEGASKREVDAVNLLMEDWKRSQGAQGAPLPEMLPESGDTGSTPVASTTFDKMKMHELRTFCKAKGVPVSRSDKKADLLARLRDGKNTS